MTKSSLEDAQEKDILDVTLARFMHCNFKAAETDLMSHYPVERMKTPKKAILIRKSKTPIS